MRTFLLLMLPFSAVCINGPVAEIQKDPAEKHGSFTVLPVELSTMILNYIRTYPKIHRNLKV